MLQIKIGIGISHVLLGTMFLIMKPYKKHWMSYADGWFLTLVGLVILTVVFENKVIYLLIIMVVLVMIVFVALFVLIKCLRRFFAHR